MNSVQKTSIAGTGGIAVALSIFKTYFADVPVEDVFQFAKTLTVNQTLEIIIPLVLGIFGIIYDEEKRV